MNEKITVDALLGGCSNEDPGVSEETMPEYFFGYKKKSTLKRFMDYFSMKKEMFSFYMQVRITPFLIKLENFLFRGRMKA